MMLRGGQLYFISDLMRLFGISWKTGTYFSRLWLSEALRTRQDSKINYTVHVLDLHETLKHVPSEM
jgi:hypothetical protein